MALKDWKRQIKTKNMIIWISPNKKPDNITMIYNEETKFWYVRRGRKILGKFKTKKQAMRFAKAYMRKN